MIRPAPFGKFSVFANKLLLRMAAVPMLAARDDGAAWLRRLRQAALLDEQGIALDGALKTIATL